MCQSEHNQYLMLIRKTQYQCLTCERGLPNCQYFESQYYLAFVLINGRNHFVASNQVTRWTWRCLLKSSLSSIVASFAHLLENCEDEPKEAVDELDDREDGSSDPETQVPTDRPQERCKTLDIFSFAQYFIRLVLFFISSVRSSSGYHGLLEGSSTHFFRFFKFFRFESESESERTQHVLYF